MTERRRFSAKVKADVIARFGGKCAHPGCTVTSGFEFDHIIPLDIGGKDDASNLQPLCSAHHKAKTALDIKMIAKSRRIRAKEAGTWRPNRKRIQSRPFDTTKVRTFSGEVRERATHRARIA